MFQYHCLNPIAEKGLKLFGDNYKKTETADQCDAILVRSAKMHDMELAKSVCAVARAGAGVNNIPVKEYAEKGVVVFNTPGANANGVKELVLAGMLLASEYRRRHRVGLHREKDKEHIGKLAEKQEKTVRRMRDQWQKAWYHRTWSHWSHDVKRIACSLGMEVYGYDPYLSIDAAWNLSRTIKHSKSLDEIYSQCDYITIHVPLLDSTKKMINKEAFDKMKDGVVLLNFARDLLVDEDALIEAVESGKVKKYVTDFANETVAGREGILVTPHLELHLERSEENCAEMAVKEIRDYLENGNIKNSVNYPNCDMGTCVAVGRISLAHSNTPNMISQVTKILGSEGLNIADMTNKSKGEFAYTLIDLESAASAKALDELKEIEGMYRVHVLLSNKNVKILLKNTVFRSGWRTDAVFFCENRKTAKGPVSLSPSAPPPGFFLSAWLWRVGVLLTCVCMLRYWIRKVEPMEENGLRGCWE